MQNYVTHFVPRFGAPTFCGKGRQSRQVEVVTTCTRSEVTCKRCLAKLAESDRRTA